MYNLSYWDDRWRAKENSAAESTVIMEFVKEEGKYGTGQQRVWWRVGTQEAKEGRYRVSI